MRSSRALIFSNISVGTGSVIYIYIQFIARFPMRLDFFFINHSLGVLIEIMEEACSSRSLQVISPSHDLVKTRPRLFQFLIHIKPSHQTMSTTSSQSLCSALTVISANIEGPISYQSFHAIRFVQGTALSLFVSPRNTHR